MFTQPALDRLSRCENILIAGAGGGFDVYAGMPLYFALRAAGHTVHLANLSFSALDVLDGPWWAPDVAEVRADAFAMPYFPERVLAGFLAEQGEPAPVYALRNVGVIPTRRGYQALVDRLHLDAIVLVDGGSDALMRGDEFGLGTPAEDMTSIAAVSRLDVRERMLLSVGFGVDHYHGVCHAQVLRAVAELTALGGHLGSLTLLPAMPEVAKYLALVEYARTRTMEHPSIVTTSIADAIVGAFGNVHSNPRTVGSTLFINPLMAIAWFFDLPILAERVEYLPHLEFTESWGDVRRVVMDYRAMVKHRPWEDIPL